MEFSFFHPVTELFLRCLLYFCIHTSTQSKQIMKSIHFESIDSLIAQVCTNYGAIIQICSKLFTKNNDVVFKIANYFQSYSSMIGNCQIILDFIDNPGTFVKVFAESYGLTHWINSGNEYQEEFTNCIVLMLRAFILFSTSDFLIVNALYHENPVPEYLRPRLKRLAEIGVAEHIGRNKYVLSRQLYASVGKSGTHTRIVGLDRETNMELLLKHIRSNGDSGTQFKELQQVLPNLSRNEIKVLMRELKNKNLIYAKGNTSAARWFAY